MGKACEALGVRRVRSRFRAIPPPFAMKPQRVGHPGSAAGLRLGLVGCHGQTVFHQGVAAKYLGKDVRCTWQMGEASVIAERLRVRW